MFFDVFDVFSTNQIVFRYILVPVFTWDNPWPILGIVLIMMGLAAREAAVRVKRSYKGTQI